MPTSPSDHGPSPTSTATAPPPGCPFHDLGSQGLPHLDERLPAPGEDETPLTDPYAELRAEHGEVARIQLPGVPPEIPVWLVLGWRANVEVARNQAAYTSDPAGCPVQGVVGPTDPLGPLVHDSGTMNFKDGTELAELRAPLIQSLNQFSRRGIRKHVERSANTLIDEFIERGSADLVAEFTQQLPMMVMTRLLGLPEESGPQLIAECRELMSGSESAAEANASVVRSLQQLVAAKLQLPGFDLPSLLLTGYGEFADRRKLDDAQLAQLVVEQLRLLIVTLQTPTTNLIADTIRMLLTDQKARADFRGGTMPVPEAVSRTLSDFPPLPAIPARYAREDTTLGGKKIAKGDMLLMGLAAGNTDPEVRPDLSVPLKDATLAFSFGPHECPGRDIGKAIAEIACETLFARVPQLELSAAPVRDAAFISLALVSLPVTFPPAKRQSLPPRPAPTSTPKPPTTPTPPPPASPAPPAPWWRTLFSRPRT